MKISRVLLYGGVVICCFVLLHIFFPSFLSSGVKFAIDMFFQNPLVYWWFIFPLIGLMILFGLLIYYGILCFASFGRGYKVDTPYYGNISILIASKDEKTLLERTLQSIVNSEYPKDKIQIVVVTSGSTDGSAKFCESFAQKHQDTDIVVLNENLPKKGKPPALNYGLKYVKNEIVVLYDTGCILMPNTLKNLISPFQSEESNAVIGPVLVKNWKENLLTRAIMLDYSIISGGGIAFEIKNRLGSSAYSYGRNFAVRKKYLDKFGGFNEDSLTEDLYLCVLLNLEGINVRFSPNAKIYEYVPSTWDILVKQRTRWLAGYTFDSPQLMNMEKNGKSGKPIIISRNMTMMLLGNLDTWTPIVIGFAVLFFLIGEYYLLSWAISCLIFHFVFLLNAIRKYADKHYSLFFLFLLSGYIHLYMFIRQFRLPNPAEMSWEKTPMLFQKEEEEIEAISAKIKKTK
ncbi:MAG: glycosyltransferase family 2 protein [Promethearchaeota archaeon]|nr:MAG: glycosyltransferase family 2 protein [Candidatus Lokiarchaeota archaeon]